MEKRIKTLYTITIAAIVAFAAMQFFWLDTRYEAALQDHEALLAARTRQAFDDYMEQRLAEAGKHRDRAAFNNYTTSLSLTVGDTVPARRRATIRSWHFNAHDILGLPDSVKLSPEQMGQAAAVANDMFRCDSLSSDSVVYDASGAPSENDTWVAARHVQVERDTPFKAAALDSFLVRRGVRARVALILADSMQWSAVTERIGTHFRPRAVFLYPYSELEGKSVRIECPIGLGEILPGMMALLVATLVLSALLVLCFIWQIATIKKLNRADRVRSDFVTTMIHELKRPLSTLKMCVSGLDNARMAAAAATRSELLAETRTALDNLSAYFSRLRDITFNSVEQIPLTIEPVNLRALFAAVASAAPVPSGKTVRFANDIAPDVTLPADRGHLTSILANLVENAVKYSGPEVRITASALVRAQTVELTIADTGLGMSPSDQRRIFRRFYRGRAASSGVPGMGLGLAYVRLLVSAHGGDITVRSREGEGSSFTLRFPQE